MDDEDDLLDYDTLVYADLFGGESDDDDLQSAFDLLSADEPEKAAAVIVDRINRHLELPSDARKAVSVGLIPCLLELPEFAR